MRWVLTISRQELEERVLSALRDKLMRRDLFEEFCREYVRELNRLRMEHRAKLSQARQELTVVEREIQGAPDEVLLVLDATTGQNAIAQARSFTAAVDVTGVVLTKLDGSARGGVVLAIREELGLPVQWVGLGEGVEDLEPFDAERFAESLVSAPAGPP